MKKYLFDSPRLLIQQLVRTLRRRSLELWGLPVLLLSLPATAVEAQYSYTTNNATITITQYTGPGGTVTIPAAIVGLPVTSIGAQAFAFDAGITNVVIPGSVTNIGASAFSECSKLASVTLGNSVASIGDQAFFNCVSLASVTLPRTVGSIGNEAFYGCSRLNSVSLPNGLTNISPASFSWCVQLTSINIPASLTNIGNFAFDSCLNLTAITVDPLNGSYASFAGVLFTKDQTTLIQCPGAKSGVYSVPNGVREIGSSAFRNCDFLTSLSIPNSVTNIGGTAFSACTTLTSINVDVLNPSYSSLAGVLFDKTQATLIQCPAGMTGTYTVPNSVTSILTTAFLGCAQLNDLEAGANNSAYLSQGGILFNKNRTTLVQFPGGLAGNYAIPSSVTRLGDYSLAYCRGLNGIIIPDTVTNIGLATFAGDIALTTLSIPASVTTIGSEAFEACRGLTSLMLSEGLTSLGSYTFYQCSGLTNLVLPGSLTSIPDHAFQACSGLTTLYVPNTITNIGPLALGFCPSLTSLFCRGNAPSTDRTAFANDTASVYYIATTSGWSSTLAGLPTEPWNPQIQTNDSIFGFKTNRFNFRVTGPVNLQIVVQACTNLANPVWSPLQTNILAGGSAVFNDPQWSNYRARFYRVLAP